MSRTGAIRDGENVVSLQERRLDRTVLRTYRKTADIDDIVPNTNQPRLGPKKDDEFQRQIEANGGLFEPLLVEPHPELPGNSGSLTAIAGGRIPASLWNAARRNIARFRLRLRTVPFPKRTGCGCGFTFTGNARNGTPRKKKWWRIGLSI